MKFGRKFLMVSLLCWGALVTSSWAKEWNIMIYMAADNNLDSYAKLNMEQITRAGGSSEFMDVTVMYDGRAKQDSKYLHFNNEGKIDGVQTIGEIDSGDVNQLDRFVRWSKQNYPANHYMLVLWNHGSGWDYVSDIHIDGIAYDDNGSNITTVELGNFLKNAPMAFDILSYDACLMQMMEVLYETKNYVRYVVGSETLEPGEGWPYDKIMLQEEFTAEEFVTNLVESFGVYGDTLSAIDVLKFEMMLPAFRSWAQGLTKSSLATLKKSAVSFSHSDGYDLGNMIFASGQQDLYQQYQDMFVAVTNNGAFKAATGLAIYAPSYFNRDYVNLAFAKDYPEWLRLIR